MAKITSKLQITVPKALADRYDLHPGDEIRFEPADQVIRLVPSRTDMPRTLDVATRIELFDAATRRQRERQHHRGDVQRPVATRRWTREELYQRGGAD